jgi:murein DD-endopeptidase MepM/ murein hydrolase activator NlpD
VARATIHGVLFVAQAGSMTKNFLWALIFALPLTYACTSSKPGFFSKSTPHEQYGKGLDNAGLKATTLGTKWFTEAASALSRPLPVTIPYRQAGYFAADGHRALGLSFTAKRGVKLLVTVTKNPVGGFLLFTELWLVKKNGRPELLSSMDSTSSTLSHDVDEDGTFVLRLQPELLRSGDYTLSISIAPSLRFPVAGKNGRVQSVWGDARDAGARRHEGIDIFAPKRTPVVASAAGTVSRVEETSIGGKVVWLRPQGRSINLYYAHLDSQSVRSGQDVQAGDTLGLMGNTGNARTTSPHLHFGIYGYGGAIDPLPFVYITNGTAPPVRSDVEPNKYWRLLRDWKEEFFAVKKNTPIWVTDVTSSHVVARLPDETVLRIPSNAIQLADIQLVAIKLKDSLPLYDAPLPAAPVKRVIATGTTVKVVGTYNTFSLVVVDGNKGWIQLPS